MNLVSNRKGSLFLFFFILSPLLWGQPYHITRINQEDGLSYDKIMDIIQDEDGLIWIATQHGLNRYDGQDIEIFRSSSLDSLSIEANYLTTFYQSKNEDQWIGMAIGGISRYNQLSRQFEYFVYDRENRTNANNSLKGFVPGRGDDYWVIMNANFNLLDIPNRTYHPFTIISKEKEVPIRFFIDQEQNEWLLFEDGLYGVGNIDYQKKEIYLKPPVMKAEMLNAFPELVSNRVFLFTKKGLFYLDQPSLTIHPVEFKDTIDFGETKLNIMSKNKDGDCFVHLTNNRIYQIDDENKATLMLDKDGRPVEAIWIYSNENTSKLVTSDAQQNIHLYTPQKKQWEKLEIPNRNIWTCVEVSKEGIIWLGSWAQGVVKIESKYEGLKKTYFPKNDQTSLDYASANAFLDWDSNHLFVGSPYGLYLLDSSNTLQSYQTNDSLLNEKLKWNILHLMKDHEDYIWVSMSHQLLRFHPLSSQYKIYRKNRHPSIQISMFYHTLEDHQHNIWIGGIGGLAVIPAGSDSIICYVPQVNQTPPSYIVHPRTIYEDHQKQIWLGSGITGLAKANLHREGESYRIEVKNYPWKKGQTINQILEKDERYLWLGNYSSGLMLFDKEKEEYLNADIPGLSAIPNIQGLIWQEEKLWISAINGLYSFQPNPPVLKHYTTLDGLHNNVFEMHACMKKKNGDLLFGGQQGLTCVNPKQIREIADPYEILLTDFYLAGNSAACPEVLQKIKNIDLAWNENYLGFEIKKPIYFSGQQHKLLYQMEGLESYWTQLYNQNHISYPALKPGKYTLRIRSVGQDGAYPNQEKRIAIHIRAPFWESHWFSLFILCSFVIMSFLFYRQLLRNKMRKVKFLNKIRQKAAADFHDETGHRLARISLFSEVLKYKLNGPKEQAEEYLKLIRENVHSLNSSMRDFLWVLNPAQDSAFDLALVLKDFGDDFFDQTAITFTTDHLNESLKEIHLTMDQKRHIVLIFKEAMTNILKHAKASKNRLQFVLQKGILLICLEDDGIGIRSAEMGYGLQNMHKRAAEINARLLINSLGKGTNIQLKLRLNQK